MAKQVTGSPTLEPHFLKIAFDSCPHCGVGGERCVLPVPVGGVNHRCSNCRKIISVRADGFTDTWQQPGNHTAPIKPATVRKHG